MPARTDPRLTSTAVASATLRERLDQLPELAGLGGAHGGIVAGVPSGAVGLLAWWLRERTSRTVLVVAAESERVYADSLVWDGGNGVAIFPGGRYAAVRPGPAIRRGDPGAPRDADAAARSEPNR